MNSSREHPSRTGRIMNKPVEERSTLDHLFVLGDCSDLDFGEFITTIQMLDQSLKNKPPTRREKILLTLLACSDDSPQANLGLGAIMLNLPPEESQNILATVYCLARTNEAKQTVAKALSRGALEDLETHVNNLVANNLEFHNSVKGFFDQDAQSPPPNQMPTVHTSITLDTFPA